jgi:hypothetical protein
MDLLFEALFRFAAKLFAHFAVWEPIKQLGLPRWLALAALLALLLSGIYYAANRRRQNASGKRKKKGSDV